MKNYISESIEKDNEQEYTIWSSSDFAEGAEQIPLVKIKVDSEGELYAEAIGNDNLDQESYRIAKDSLKYSVGRPLNDRLLRVDKSLNHSDPFFSTELQRDNIKATRGNTVEKKDIDIDVEDVMPTTEAEKEARRKELKKSVSGFTDTGLKALASQVLVTNRDDLKAAATSKYATEGDLAHLFGKLTGVDYYTNKITDEDQYSTLLTLLGKDIDKYSDNYEGPEDNEYVKGLKDLTETLIEKVNLRNNPNFYDDGNMSVNTSQFKNKLRSEARQDMTIRTEDDVINNIVDLYNKLTGVDFLTDKIIDNTTYEAVLSDLGIEESDPKDLKFLDELKEEVDNLIGNLVND